ncbi:MAG: hypothetical protein IPN13_20940 [Bacteroidetes bacterium]|nr:hypothetical protein [Bacteroidota bacterium]
MFLLRSQRFLSKKKEATTPVLHPGRRPFPSHLPRVEVAIEPLESVTGPKVIGKEITEQLNMNPEDYL